MMPGFIVRPLRLHLLLMLLADVHALDNHLLLVRHHFNNFTTLTLI